MKKTALGLPHARLVGKLDQKGVTRPKKLIAERLPAGAGKLLAGGTPLRKDAEFGPVGDEAADARFAVAVRESASEFANAHRAKSTGKEHEEYAMRFEDYLVYAGHGSFFREVPGVKRGEGSVALQAGPKGEPKVVAPELIVAWLQESYTGSENAPKGGLLRRGHGSPSRLPSCLGSGCAAIRRAGSRRRPAARTRTSRTACRRTTSGNSYVASRRPHRKIER